MKNNAATRKRVYAMSLAGVYPHYVAEGLNASLGVSGRRGCSANS
jgi:hypothetical protein